MAELLRVIEGLAFSTYVRESSSLLAFPTLLFVHNLGVSLVAGGSFVLSLALLGLWPRSSLVALDRLYATLWTGFALNALTGVALLMADATRKGANPVFWIKMIFVAAGVVVLTRIRRQLLAASEGGALPASATFAAWATIGCWLGAITAGRLLAYVG